MMDRKRQEIIDQIRVLCRTGGRRLYDAEWAMLLRLLRELSRSHDRLPEDV
jgi:hypothetical protein